MYSELNKGYSSGEFEIDVDRRRLSMHGAATAAGWFNSGTDHQFRFVYHWRFAWSPDGKKIAMTRSSEIRDVVLVRQNR